MAYTLNAFDALNSEEEHRRKVAQAFRDEQALKNTQEYSSNLTDSQMLNAAISAESFTKYLFDQAKDALEPSGLINPDFVVTSDLIEKKGRGLPPEVLKTFRAEARHVRSEYEMEKLRERLDKKDFDNFILNTGSGGTGYRIGAAVLDPVSLGAETATGGAALVSNIGSRLGKIAVGAAAGGMTGMGIEAAMASNDPQNRSVEDFMYGSAGGIASGMLGTWATTLNNKNGFTPAKVEENLRKQKWAASGIDSAPKVDDIVTYNLNGAEYPIKVTGLSPEDGRIYGKNIFTNADVTIEAGAARAPSAEVKAKVDEWAAANKKAAEDAYKADALRMVQEADAATKAQKVKDDVMASTIDRAQQGRAHNNRQKDLEAAFNGNITDHTKLADPVRTGSVDPKVLDVAGEKLTVSTPAAIMRKGGTDRVAQLLSTVGEMQAFTKRKLDAGMESIRTKGAQRTRMELLTALMKKADNVVLDANETALLKEFPTMEAFDAARRPVQSASDEFINKLMGKGDAPEVKNADIAVENVRSRPKDAPGVGFGKADEVTPDGGIIVSPRRKKAAKAKAEPTVKPVEQPTVKVVGGADPVVTKGLADAADEVPQAIRKEAIQEGDHIEFSKVNKDGEEEFFSGRVTGVGNYIVVKTADGTKSAKLENIIKHTSNSGLYRKATVAERLGAEGLLNKVDDTVDDFAGIDERVYTNPMLNATESPAVRAIGEALDGSPKLADDLMSACELARTAGADTGKATRKTKKK
jgi:hypothetical protein